MAFGDNTVPSAQTRSAYIAQNSKLRGEAFSAMLNISQGTTNILSHLMGSPGSGAPFVVQSDLSKGAKSVVNFNVGARLGTAGRLGTEQAVNYEEQLIHNSWSVEIDTLRVVVGWNEITALTATTGEHWRSLYPRLCGERMGEIKRESMLMRLRQRSSTSNTIRPGNRASLNALRYDDTLDTATLGRGIGSLGSLGAKAAKVGKSTSGMEIMNYVALGTEQVMDPLWSDTVFTGALQHAEVDGKENPFWTNNIPNWRGLALKRWTVVADDHPGAIGTSLMPQAILGDAITSGTAAFTIYGGGRTQATLGDAKVIYKPFAYFYGNEYKFGESITSGADANTYYLIVVDPADGKWGMYSYVATNSNGNSITVTGRLHSSTSGIANTALGEVTYDSNVNKVAFPTGSLIYQVNSAAVPVADLYLFGADAGAFCYGKIQNKAIQDSGDYGALQGKGVETIYGCDLRKDTLGNYRGFLRVQCAYEIPGVELPTIA